MALTNAQQKKLIDDVNKTKKAMGRSEIRERAMTEYLEAIAFAVTDRDSRLRSDVNKTKMAVGRLEQAWQEEQAQDEEAVQDSEEAPAEDTDEVPAK